MVDSINSTGGVPPQNNNRTQSRNESQRNEQRSESSPVDSVEISAEAFEANEAAQAERVAAETRSLLEQQRDEALTGAGQRVDQLL